MRILYLHGLYSRPGGTKVRYLLERGHEVINPGLPDVDFDESVAIAQEAFDTGDPDVVVGSSRGGAVAMNLETKDIPVVLIAPAWKRWGKAVRMKPGTIVIHSENDAVIPIEDSREAIAASGLPLESLVVSGADHNMVDDQAFDALMRAITMAEQRAVTSD